MQELKESTLPQVASINAPATRLHRAWAAIGSEQGLVSSLTPTDHDTGSPSVLAT